MSTIERPYRGANYRPDERSFTQTLSLQIRVIGALTMRSATARFGHENLGFFWVMGEPLLLTLGVMAMWSITGMTHGHGVGLVPFALTGYTMLTLWRHIVGTAVQAIRRNAGLLFHRNVRILDILISRALLEIVGLMTAFFIAYIPMYLLGFMDAMSDPLAVIGSFWLLGWFSFAFGMIITGLSELSEPMERFVPPILYITLPFTGAFYMLSWLPEEARVALSWSPLVNTQEMIRSGLFPPDIPTYWSASYVVVWCLALTAIGLLLISKAQKHITMD